MSKPIKFKLIASGLEKLEGKYTASVLSNGTYETERITRMITDGRPAMDEADATLAISALAAEISTQMALGNTVLTPIGYFSPDISGSVPSMDARLDPETNPMRALFTANPALNTMLASLSPRLDADSLDVKIFSVEDATSHEVGVIKGTAPFIVTGKGLSLSQTGERLDLIADDGSVLSTSSYVAQGSQPPEWVKATLSTAVAAGSYRLRLTTRGYNNPTGDLVEITKNVTVKAA